MHRKCDHILLIEQDFPEYRLEIFNRLADRLKPRLLELAYGALNENHYHRAPEVDQARYKCEEVGASWLLGGRILWLNYFKVIRGKLRPRAIVVRHSIRNPLLVPFVLWCRIKGIPIVLWGQGFSRRRDFNPRGHLFDWINLRIVGLADAYVVYSRVIKNVLQEYIDGERLYVGSNTLNLRGLDAHFASLKSKGRAKLRKELGMGDECQLVYVGRLQKRKKPVLLLEALVYLAEHTDVSYVLTVVGQGEEESALREFVMRFDQIKVHFLGSLSVNDPRLVQRLYASDLMVIPGWLGLAVNHAFYCELPVVTTSMSIDMRQDHPPEAVYLKHGVNGAVDTQGTVAGLAGAIEYARVHRDELSCGAGKTYAEEMDIDLMIDGFVSALRHVGVGGRSSR